MTISSKESGLLTYSIIIVMQLFVVLQLLISTLRTNRWASMRSWMVPQWGGSPSPSVCSGLLVVAFFVRGNRESLPFSKHLMSHFGLVKHYRVPMHVIIHSSVIRSSNAEYSPQLFAPSCCWRAATEINSPSHWINGLYMHAPVLSGAQYLEKEFHWSSCHTNGVHP